MEKKNTHHPKTTFRFLYTFIGMFFIASVSYGQDAPAQSGTWRVKTAPVDTTKTSVTSTSSSISSTKTTPSSSSVTTPSATTNVAATATTPPIPVTEELKKRAWVVTPIADSLLADGLPEEDTEVQYTASEIGAIIASSTGKASWYGTNFHGRRTANGEIFNCEQLTAAHRSLPFGSMVRVTNLNNNRSVVVRINDRGPYTNDGRIIDLSRASAEAVGMIQTGTAQVQLELLDMTTSSNRGEYVQSNYASNTYTNANNSYNSSYTNSYSNTNYSNGYTNSYNTNSNNNTYTSNTNTAASNNYAQGNSSTYYNYQNRNNNAYRNNSANTNSYNNSRNVNPIEAKEVFTVQVASFTDSYRAEMASRGYNGGWVSQVSINGMTVFRVNVGKYHSRMEAEQGVSRFRQSGVNGFVKQI